MVEQESSSTIKHILQRDKKHVWHPLTQHGLEPEHIAVSKAKGSVLYDVDGKEYIDAIASWYTSVYGHCNEFITKKVSEQMGRLDQIVFSGFTHEPAVTLSEKLMTILPANQNRIFFSDNGSTTVEVAIKMAIQFHYNKQQKHRVILAFNDGFHGDTFGAMSVSGLSVYNGPFDDLNIKVKRVDAPNDENLEAVLRQLGKLVSEDNIAAFIYEPLVQGAAGMKMHQPMALDAILKYLKSKGVLLIADEVMTGFGKTGKNFASDHIPTKPDIMCLSKALTAGLMPMGITSCSEKIFKAFLSDKIEKGFFHGHTYSANPLACTAAIAGIDLLKSEDIRLNIAHIIQRHKMFTDTIDSHPRVKSTRQTGIIFALDLDIDMARYGNMRDKLFRFFMSKGVYLRPLGNTIYIHPPYVISDEQLDKIYNAINSALDTF